MFDPGERNFLWSKASEIPTKFPLWAQEKGQVEEGYDGKQGERYSAGLWRL